MSSLALSAVSRRAAALQLGAALLVYLALGTALLWPTLCFGDRVLSAAGFWTRGGPFPAEFADQVPPDMKVLSDSVVTFVPWLRYAADHVAADGSLPLWKDTAMCGAPFLGNGQSALLFPTVLPAILLGAPPWIHGMQALVKLVGGALCAWLLARHLKLSFLAALLCGAIYGFGGFQVTWLLFPQTNAALLLPLVLLAADRAVLAPSARNLGLLALVAGLQHLGGHPETAFHSQVLALACAVLRTLSLHGWSLRGTALRGEGGQPGAARRMACACGGLLLGAGVGSIQILPLLEYLFLSEALQVRRHAVDLPALEAPLWSGLFVLALVVAAFAFHRLARGRRAPWRAGLALLLAGGTALLAGMQASLSPACVQLLASDWFGDAVRCVGPVNYVASNGAFAGAALPLAALGLLHGRSRGIVALLGAALVLGLLAGFRAPVVTDLLQLLPGFSVAANERLQVVALLSTALLAAFGIDALGQVARGAHGRSRLALACAIPALCIAGAFGTLVSTGLMPSPNVPARPPGTARVSAMLVTQPVAARLHAVLPAPPPCTEKLLEPAEGRVFAGIVALQDEVVGARLVYGRDARSVYARFAALPAVGTLAAQGLPGDAGLRYAFHAVAPAGDFLAERAQVRIWLRYESGAVALSDPMIAPDDVAPRWLPFPVRPMPGRAPAQLILLAGVALLAVLLLHAAGWRRAVGQIAAVLLVGASLCLFAAENLPMLPTALFYPESPPIAALKALPPDSRMLNMQDHRFLPELPGYYGILDASGYDALYPRHTADVLRAAVDVPDAATTKAPMPRREDVDLRLLGVMSVRALCDYRADPGALEVKRYGYDSDPCTRPYVIATNPYFLPRARLVGGAIVESDDERALRLLRDPAMAHERSVVLASGTERPAPEGSIGTAAIALSRPDLVRVTIAPTAPGWLVLSDTFFPGWQALVDGEPREIVRANVAFRAVAVQPGERVVEFRYEPFWFRVGVVLSLLSGPAALLACLVRRSRTDR